MKLCIVILVCLCLTYEVKSSNVLFLATFPTHSHFSLMFRLAKEMADRGHQVTMISPYPQKNPIKNYKDLPVVSPIKYFEDFQKTLLGRTQGTLQSLTAILDICRGVTELTFQNEDVQTLMKSKQTFDLVVMEHFFNEAFIGFGYVFKAPVVALSSVSANNINNFLTANPGPSSYIPNLIGSSTKHMNFWQRLENFLMNSMADIMRHVWFLPKQRDLFNKYVSLDVDFNDILYNVSIMLTNSHVSVSDPTPTVPAVIEIGGFHVNPPRKLPKDLQKFLDESKEGAILFSLGSNLKSKDLKPETKDAILKAFSKIKQNVLWKFETDLPDAPPNLKVVSWIPQQDVLAHPNIRAFITHGGLLSTIETVYHGVPIIGIPIFGDQKSNIGRATNYGFALSLSLSEVTEENLSKVLNEILNNPKYRENVKQRSKLMHDQPLKPIDSAVYWMEHVIRHKGGPHLRSAGLDLMWYQRELVDVVSFLIFAVVSILVLLYIAVKKVVNFLCKKKNVAAEKKQKIN